MTSPKNISRLKLKKTGRKKYIKNAFQKYGFYCSTLSAPISRLHKMLGIRSRENNFLCRSTKNGSENFSHFQGPAHGSCWKSSLGRMHNETHRKLLQKQNLHYWGGKKLFIPCFSWYYAGEAEIIEKKWPQDVLYFTEWIIYGRRVHSERAPTALHLPGRSLNCQQRR